MFFKSFITYHKAVDVPYNTHLGFTKSLKRINFNVEILIYQMSDLK